ncbi:von Willebrand factor A domain-containing protein 5A-like isoform X3 [Scleropages formosus]|uniref:von Willebrand factor A domain-containing protein 5A-like isoform X3 n=1 Tax=Scleropages formosus TaxID=113540 RepID=UPI0010FA6FF4|nr:von Willebrand factor A domain-containing protein 5A-like isoform X3 [Scleropages formosus]
MATTCGLRTLKNEPVPLKSVSVEVDVQGHVASVNSTLQYENQESNPVEAIFIFPMDSNAAVYRFLARIGDVEIEAQVREKEKAKEEYDDAISSGQEAFLLEESDESSDVFRLSVGSLPPGQTASVTVGYVSELAVQADHALRFCLPAVLNPRYTPPGSSSMTTEASPQAGDVPYTLSLTMNIYTPSFVQTVESNCPLTPLAFLSQDKTQAKVSLAPGHRFDRDVELLLYYSEPHQPMAILEAGQPGVQSGSLMGDTVAMLSFYPVIEAEKSSHVASSGEFIFLVDRSGSMECPMNQNSGDKSRISSARDTLLLLLKSLPLGCYFNICGFGSEYESFFPESVEYTQATMESAVKMVKSMEADLGGTEILPPLQNIYSKPCLPSHPRQLFVFTDGEVGNTKEVINLVKSHAHSHRCFTFGIGEGASSALVNGMAEGGSGHPQFITGSERMQPKVMQSLQYALNPVAKDIAMKWNIPAEVSVTPLSPPVNVLFNLKRVIQYFQLTGQNASNMSGSVSLHYIVEDKPFENKISLNLKPDADNSMLLHRLGARKAIVDLEGKVREGDDKSAKERVVELSIQSGVSSSYTAFIGVNRENKEPVQGPLQRRLMAARSLFAGSYPVNSICGKAPSMGLIDCGLYVQSPECCAAPSSDHSCDTDEQRSSSSEEGECEDYAEQANISVEEPEDPMVDLIGLQRADGSWDLQQSLASILGKQEEEVVKASPGKPEFSSVWATVLAVLWLHGYKAESRDEWQFVAKKAMTWVRAQSGFDLTEFVAAGNSFLGLQVKL